MTYGHGTKRQIVVSIGTPLLHRCMKNNFMFSIGMGQPLQQIPYSKLILTTGLFP